MKDIRFIIEILQSVSIILLEISIIFFIIIDFRQQSEIININNQIDELKFNVLLNSVQSNIAYFDFDNRSELGWDSPHDLPNKFIGFDNLNKDIWLDSICNITGSIIYDNSVNGGDIDIISCKINNTRYLDIYSKEELAITLNTSKDIRYLINNKTKEIYFVEDGLVDLGVVKPYERIILRGADI